jgi:hypothetical protein
MIPGTIFSHEKIHKQDEKSKKNNMMTGSRRAGTLRAIQADKPDANHISVTESIIKTIIEPVHQKDVRVLPCFLPLRLARKAPPLLRTSE